LRKFPEKQKGTLADTRGDELSEVFNKVDKELLYSSILKEAKQILQEDSTREQKLQKICWLLHREVGYFDWVGIYLGDSPRRELVLGPYVGKPTEHTRIPFGRGICGQVAESKETFVVQDVSQEKNYLPCDSCVKSEMVVPIFKNQKFVGELDIDSHQLAPFTEADRKNLGKMCLLLEELF
jgi:L-methionine (R)-S-oxide reductase